MTQQLDMAQAETEEERAEVARDLRQAAQAALGRDEQAREWTMDDMSPRRRLYVLYNMLDGERVAVPKFVFDQALTKRIPGTRNYAFTTFKDRAPKKVVSGLKCFLHPDSAESEVVRNTLGIDPRCDANNLKNTQAKRLHAQKKHQAEWGAFVEYQQDQERKRDRDIQEKQLQATLSLAQAAVGRQVPVTAPAEVVDEFDPSEET